MKNQSLRFKIFVSCTVAAAITLAILSAAERAAKIKLGGRQISPDYVRFMSYGYEFDTVSTKKNYLITVTDGGKPARIHIFTVDCDKKTLDILELPPDSYIFADGFIGTLSEAFETSVYRQLVSAAFCLRIDGEANFDAKTFGDCAELLKAETESKNKKREVKSVYGERISKKGGSYSSGDEDCVLEYRRLLALMLEKICEKGAVESFSLLLNLIVNRVDTNMTIEDIAEAADGAVGIKPENIFIRLACGRPADFSGKRIWALDPEKTAELLNQHFRVKDSEYPAESLGLPDISAGKIFYKNLPERAADIID